VTSVVIPAHNEGAVIGRLLERILDGAKPDEFDIVVVANGCTDDTVAVARSFEPGVRVIDSPVASKAAALRLGDARARGFPLVYVDADVEVGADDLRALARAVEAPGVLAAAPERTLVLAGRPLAVRWYYTFWQRLRVVREGLFGRGVVAVNAAGYERIATMPPALSDDLAASVAFRPSERRVVRAAYAVIHTPRTSADLLRRRVRSITGTVQLEQRRSTAVAEARTGRGDILGVVRANPLLMPHMLVFLAFTLAIRRRAARAVRAGDFTTWLRDESSRAVDPVDQPRT
jgi:glycosyltransferase involved in cell wall biosynthesis